MNFLSGQDEFPERKLRKDEFLCEALGDVRCKLTELDLNLNYFTDEYLSSLSGSLKLEHCCLQDLSIVDCNFTDEGKRLLKKVENSEYCKARSFTILM